jgi:hypothetical protein
MKSGRVAVGLRVWRCVGASFVELVIILKGKEYGYGPYEPSPGGNIFWEFRVGFDNFLG